jgi:Rubisco Assembly chaperone C-terminal domain
MAAMNRACILTSLFASALGWIPQVRLKQQHAPLTQHQSVLPRRMSASQMSIHMSGNIHGENSCFLPLNQLEQDFMAPRIVQIAGSYPGLTREEFMAVTSEPPPEQGQWSYDFTDPEGPQVGNIALPGSEISHGAEDPVVIIAEHFSLGVELPAVIKDPVDLVVLVDRFETGFAERKFVVVDIPGNDGLKIAAYNAKADVPRDAKILGRVVMVVIPWLPSMAPTKTGFLEADNYF